MQAVNAGRMDAERTFGMRAHVIVCALRGNPVEQAVELAHLAAKYHLDGGVVGFDIAGPEKGFSASLYRDAYDVARRAGLGLTAHAGEADGWESVDRAVRDLVFIRSLNLWL